MHNEKMGPYELKSVLGRGGMGTVYEANHEKTGEELAVKVLASAYSSDSHFRNRFESEIKALLKLDHPNIVRLIGYGQEDQNLYFAMELVRGKSLFQMQREGEGFDWREVIRIAKNVALGLRHAHDRGIIHRDLKPGNLIKADSGIIKITDFGIAKRFGQDQNTGTNVLGTVDFMSPEQAKGLPVTFRSDLYSLGNVMFTLLAGRPPFTSNSFEESMRNLTKVPAPRIHTQVPNVPAGLDELIAQLLAKDPSKRIQTAQSLYHSLKKVEQDLLESSQAKTAERILMPDDDSAPNTMETSDPKTSVDDQKVSRHTVVTDPEKYLQRKETREVASGSKSNETTPDRHPDDDEDAKPDFHKRVTDDQRRGATQSPEPKPQLKTDWTKALLAGLLFGVLVLGGIGLYAANQPPSADDLLAEINASSEQPQRKLRQINAFLEAYPEHESRNDVEKLKELAHCNQLLNKLNILSKSRAGVSRIQQEFLDITSIGENELPKMEQKLNAYVALHGTRNDLSDDDQQCLEAAKIYLQKVELDSAAQQAIQRDEIREQMQRAAKANDEDARIIYQSIVELNGEFDWLKELVDQAREKLNELEQPATTENED